MAEEDEDDSCACCGSWNTYMGTYPGLHEKCNGGCGDWLCQECSFLCPGCNSKTCETCIGYDLSRLPTASDDENPEHPLHRFIKLDMSFANCELDKSNVAGELYAGINPICSRHCANEMMVDLFVSGNGTEDEDYKEACSMIAQDKWNRLTGLLKQLPALRDWRLRAAHNAHKPDGRGFKRSRDEFERHATREA